MCDWFLFFDAVIIIGFDQTLRPWGGNKMDFVKVLKLSLSLRPEKKCVLCFVVFLGLGNFFLILFVWSCLLHIYFLGGGKITQCKYIEICHSFFFLRSFAMKHFCAYSVFWIEKNKNLFLFFFNDSVVAWIFGDFVAPLLAQSFYITETAVCWNSQWAPALCQL